MVKETPTHWRCITQRCGYETDHVHDADVHLTEHPAHALEEYVRS